MYRNKGALANIIASIVIEHETKLYDELVHEVTDRNLRESQKLNPDTRKRFNWAVGFINGGEPYMHGEHSNAKIVGSTRARLPSLLPEVANKYPNLSEDLLTYHNLLHSTRRRVLWLLAHCKTAQDCRDALPDSVFRIFQRASETDRRICSDIMRLERTRPALWNHADNPNSATEAEEIIQFMEAQSVMHMIMS